MDSEIERSVDGAGLRAREPGQEQGRKPVDGAAQQNAGSESVENPCTKGLLSLH